MADPRQSLTILETCLVAPPAEGPAAAEQTLPLTFFDIGWLNFHPIQRLLFYKLPCSTAHFYETIVPTFKRSLSLTLKHFLPVAGNLICPLNSDQLPYLRYAPGDSISVTVAEYLVQDLDFNYLTGNHSRDADEFYAFFSELSPPETQPELGVRVSPIFTAQITLFPDNGICVGFNNNHIVGDASSIVRFIKAWSFISRLGNDGLFLAGNQTVLPVFDRSVVKDPSGRLLNTIRNQIKDFKIVSQPLNFPTKKVRATHILKREDIQKLKTLVKAKTPNLSHLSSFTIATAYVWTCMAKSAAASGEIVSDDEPEYFAFPVDARGRTNPPISAAYFGNCLGLVYTQSTHADLKGDLGFLIAAELIGELISQKVNKEEEILRDADEWIPKFVALIGKRLFGIAGSPRFDLYDADFGWGKPIKYESLSIDRAGSVSLCKSREFEGGLEIGLSLNQNKMDAFGGIFSSLLETKGIHSAP